MNKEEIERLSKELEELHARLDNVIKEYEEESKEWKPELGEDYYFVMQDEEGDYYIKDYEYDDDGYDEKVMKSYKVFKTRAEAQEYADYLKAIAERTYKFSKEEWEDDTLLKWNIKYINEDKFFDIENCWTTNCFNKFTFKTHEEAQAFIDEYGDKILKYEM